MSKMYAIKIYVNGVEVDDYVEMADSEYWADQYARERVMEDLHIEVTEKKKENNESTSA